MSDSWTIRAAATSTTVGSGLGAPSTTVVTARPAARARSTTPSRSPIPAVGAIGGLSWPPRSDASSAWTLPIASRLAILIADSASCDCSGLVRRRDVN
ncbi:hypothetical protein ACFVKB_14335 [Rhodococcus sp. NPDC127530]|uniref:hypothetical protein n=1 Tax=unclassified Rhodococcus (in: high G+C Gram-positive bacteria) TaxID=192944 RepID=UPI003625CA53